MGFAWMKLRRFSLKMCWLVLPANHCTSPPIQMKNTNLARRDEQRKDAPNSKRSGGRRLRRRLMTVQLTSTKMTSTKSPALYRIIPTLPQPFNMSLAPPRITIPPPIQPLMARLHRCLPAPPKSWRKQHVSISRVPTSPPKRS